MNAVILGAGNVGFQLAKQLIEEEKNIVLIEKDPEKAKQAANLLDCLVLNEEGNNLKTLRKAGTGKADYFIGVTDSDEFFDKLAQVIVENLEVKIPESSVIIAVIGQATGTPNSSSIDCEIS